MSLKEGGRKKVFASEETSDEGEEGPRYERRMERGRGDAPFAAPGLMHTAAGIGIWREEGWEAGSSPFIACGAGLHEGEHQNTLEAAYGWGLEHQPMDPLCDF